MSQLHVEVCTIDQVLSHNNAEKLELAVVKGWQIVIKKGEYKPGDVAIYIPIASVVPAELSDKYNFTQYLSKGRVKSARLRGEPSHGVLVPNEGNWDVGTDVADHYKITKWTPEVRLGGGSASSGRYHDILEEHPLLPRYTDIDNLRHFPSVIPDGEEVVVTEKIHGANVRIGNIDGEYVAGSRRNRRRMPMRRKPAGFIKTFIQNILDTFFGYRPPVEADQEEMLKNWYWFPLTIPAVKNLLDSLSINHKQVVLYGEIFGANVQKGVRYGSPEKIAFRAFDMILDGKYANYDEFSSYCEQYGVEMAPLLYRGPYSLDKVKTLSEGKTTIGEGETHIREGVVVKPVAERFDPKLGRVILKYVSDQYLLAKDIGDFEDE